MTIAKATGWREKEILWDMPLARLFQYIHAVWVSEGVECEFTTPMETPISLSNRLKEIREE